jgi:hypothetical protein
MSQAIASSAVSPAIPADDFLSGLTELCGVAISSAKETIGDIGGETQRAESAIVVSQAERDRLDTLLLDWICQTDASGKRMRGEDKKYLPVDYKSFMAVRQAYVAGAFDKGAETLEAAAKVWEFAIKRCIALGFVRPKSQDPEALRKAEARKAKADALAAIPDAELREKKAALLEADDSKSLDQAKVLQAEIERRARDANAAKLDQYKTLAESIGKRAKELAKLGTPDAEDMLIRAVQVLGVTFAK